MKSAVVVSLFLYFRISLSLPVSTENVPEGPKKATQSDSVPTNLLLRDDEDTEAEVPSDDLTFIEDSIMNLLLRDTEAVTKDSGDMLFVIKEKTFTKVLSSSEDEALGVNIQSEEKTTHDDVTVSSTQLCDDKGSSLLSEAQLQPKESNDLVTSSRKNSGHLPTSLTPEETLPSSENSQTEHSLLISNSEFKISPREVDEASFLPARKNLDHALERSYADIEYTSAYPPTTAKPLEHLAASYYQPPESAIPLLLNCAPKVERGHLTEAAPSHTYKTGDDLNLKNAISDVHNSDVINLNSPLSVITTDRRRRDTWLETGATHYKVSEDHPEAIKGNHHLVSEDFPQPNMVKMIERSSMSL